MHWWKLLHTGCCCYWSTHFKRFQEQNEEHNLPLSLGNIWDIANPGQAPDNCVKVGRNKQKTNSKVQTRYSNNGVRHTHLWCENWKNETCTEHAIKQSTLAVLQPNMQLVKDSLVNLMSMLKLCHIWKHQDVPRPSEEMHWHVYNFDPFISANTKHYNMVWSGWGRLFSDTKYIDSLHKYLLKSLRITHGIRVCIENYQLLLIQTLCIFLCLIFPAL